MLAPMWVVEYPFHLIWYVVPFFSKISSIRNTPSISVSCCCPLLSLFSWPRFSTFICLWWTTGDTWSLWLEQKSWEPGYLGQPGQFSSYIQVVYLFRLQPVMRDTPELGNSLTPDDTAAQRDLCALSPPSPMMHQPQPVFSQRCSLQTCPNLTLSSGM